MFYDEARIFVRGGRGGDGMVHFRREKYVPFGGPDGGDGGRGGSVYVVGDPHAQSLLLYHRTHRFSAEAGKPGGPNRRHGSAGKDLYLPVPLGTVVREEASGHVIADVHAPGQAVLVARGGRGGLGNVHFATATQQAPRFAQKGEPPEERWLLLELQLIAVCRTRGNRPSLPG